VYLTHVSDSDSESARGKGNKLTVQRMIVNDNWLDVARVGGWVVAEVEREMVGCMDRLINGY
jgi:hypothetical protein